MKLWAGRFQKETDTLVNDFNASITFDSRLYKQDITGSIAHATMLGEQGIIAKEDADAIVAGLESHSRPTLRTARWNSPSTTRTST